MSFSVGHMNPMMRSNLMEEKLTISLSKEQRDLLLKYKSYFDDHELFRLISTAVKKGKNYEIYLVEEQLRDLLDQISELSNNEDDEVLESRLYDLCNYLSGFYDEFGEYEEEDEVEDYFGDEKYSRIIERNAEFPEQYDYEDEDE